tara:strand:- start:316 stop:948 length:633 start_codon:yes stop_codon:yes gene_type:complete
VSDKKKDLLDDLEREQHLSKEDMQLANTKTKQAYKEYAEDLENENALVQLIGCHIFYLKRELEEALEDQDVQRAINKKSMSPNGSVIHISSLIKVTIPPWVLEKYADWKLFTPEEEQESVQAFWATDTRIGMVINKTEEELVDMSEEYSKDEVVKVLWFGDQQGWKNKLYNSDDDIRFHHVRNLRKVDDDGFAVKKLFPCNFGEGYPQES